MEDKTTDTRLQASHSQGALAAPSPRPEPVQDSTCVSDLGPKDLQTIPPRAERNDRRMLVDVVAVFRCSRDAHDAFRAVKEAGVSPDLVHLLESDAPMIYQDEVDGAVAAGHSCEEAEYAAHGEHLGSRCIDASMVGRPITPAPQMTGDRLMVVVRDCRCTLAAAKLVETLFAHGAIAARNNKGPWRRSPYRQTVRQA